MAIDELTYPQPVANRQGPAPSSLAPAALGAPTAPRTYVFPFQLRATTNGRSTTSSPQLRGPSIIRSLIYSKTGTPDGTAGIALGKSASAVQESNVNVAVARPYTSLYRGLLPAGSPSTGAPADAPAEADNSSPLLSPNANLGIVVLDRDWFLTITCAADAPGGDTFSGYVVVLDEVSPQALANFL